MKRRALSLFAGLCFVAGSQTYASDYQIRQIDFEVLAYEGENLAREGFHATHKLTHYKTMSHPRFRVRLKPDQLETASLAVQQGDSLLKMDLGMRLIEMENGQTAMDLQTDFDFQSEERTMVLSSSARLADEKKVTYALNTDASYVIRAQSKPTPKEELPVDLALEEKPLPANSSSSVAAKAGSEQ